MKTCSEIREILDAFADGELDRRSARLVKKHLSSCSTCQRDFDAAQLVNSRLRETADKTVPAPDLADSIMAVLPERRVVRVRRFSSAWATAFAVLLAALSIWAFSPGHRGLTPLITGSRMAMAPDAQKQPPNAMCQAYCQAKQAGKAPALQPLPRKPLNEKCAAYCKAKAEGRAVGPPPLPSYIPHRG